MVLTNDRGFRMEFDIPIPGNIIVFHVGTQSFHIGLFPPDPPRSPTVSDLESDDSRQSSTVPSGSGGPHHYDNISVKNCPISMKFDTLQHMLNTIAVTKFLVFKMAATAIVKIVFFSHNSSIFGLKPLSTCHSATSHKISPKSDNRSMSYGQKSEVQDGGRRHLEF